LSSEWSASTSLRIEEVKVDNLAFGVPDDFTNVQGENFVVAPGLALARDTRDSIIRPTEGNSLLINFEYGMGDFSYPIVTIEDSQYFTVWERPDGSGRHVVAVRGRVGFAGDDTPLYDRFFAGGFATLRGFRFRGVGPRKDGFNVGGTFELLGSVEYQIPLLANDALYMVAFSDFGTVEDDVAIRDFRLSAGVGLRIAVPMLGPAPIALDWGFPILKADGDERRTFYFGVSVSR
jgi:outer membrane protein insertion porin family